MPPNRFCKLLLLCRSHILFLYFPSTMAALPAQFCTTQPALDHNKLAPSTQCPFCHCTGPPAQLALGPTEVTPTAPSQYTPLAPGAVNAQLRAATLARGTSVTAANAYRSQAILRATAETPASPRVPTPFLFKVKLPGQSTATQTRQ